MRAPYTKHLGLAAVLLAAAVAACSGDEDPPGNEPTPDAGNPSQGDAGTPDAGAPDSGPDAGPPDAGVPDAGPPDAGTPDAGPPGTVVIPNKLSDLKLFTGTPATGDFQPVAGNIPYELTTPLFSDYSLKSRTLYVPDGKKALYSANDVLDLPVGTIITKTFAYPADFREPDKNVRPLETRILVRQPSGWEAYPYVWNDALTEATKVVGGYVFENFEFIDAEGVKKTFNYLVPQRNQCQKCHHEVDAQDNQYLVPIGVKARYLNREHVYDGQPVNQLQHLAALGKLGNLPSANIPRAPNAFDATEATVAERARTYLDINCAHCHNPKAQPGITSRLFLDIKTTDEFSLGYCKRPGSAGSGVGGEFDIVPGDHSTSILWYRLHTEESGKMMPEIGRALRHDVGSQLIADWIDAMPPRSCK
ncbi:SO2930 family diheme c-type cytochrome [Myxococcus faecalis]|jgi:uncharacterized repeat protein (TIGR03806 family)|uniref:SO2930 family diheme c-type cytochrome n=1 Tax=Myxococcus TaxID=32 RepID=UPI001DEC8843|nr:MULTISPECIES: SO2930 family diheme c-type cytochrome [unclassified Myxococcus]MBZ4398451.1 hypothetical protein [Myxococcus sp. AS-1-15]MBZ4412648.1 hypothetical protein [Myxococcus sp. XM-1-1-1]BDT38334.1 hypothetical protein MFMH1_80030 [Myxococcus sp. MH1]